jgi:hypothetical protein
MDNIKHPGKSITQVVSTHAPNTNLMPTNTCIALCPGLLYGLVQGHLY